MKAIRLIKSGLPLELQEIAIPPIGALDVLIRVKAAGICHSDAHYRAGVSPVEPLPLTLGHEVAGVVETTGADIEGFTKGNRVCVHYLVTCGQCAFCKSGTEQFCQTAQMIGKHRDGGYAEFISVPERSVFRLPDEIPFEQGAILMCSSATSLHALTRRVCVPAKRWRSSASRLGISSVSWPRLWARPRCSPSTSIRASWSSQDVPGHFGQRFGRRSRRDNSGTHGRGVDVALELVGLPLTMRQAVQSLAIQGRAALVGLTKERFEVAPYAELLNKEAEIIGVSDHLASELPLLLDLARTGKLDLSHGIIRTVPLEAGAVNGVLDRLEKFGDDVRVVITP